MPELRGLLRGGQLLRPVRRRLLLSRRVLRVRLLSPPVPPVPPVSQVLPVPPVPSVPGCFGSRALTPAAWTASSTGPSRSSRRAAHSAPGLRLPLRSHLGLAEPVWKG